VGILTSDNEGIPSAPIEAALLEKPTIVTNVGSVEEVVLDKVTGLLCDKTIESLLNAVDLLAENESLRLEMGRKARQFAIEKFNPDSSVDRQIEGYAKAIKSISRD
jgi:glycosyltransferase involved in cell wall biosynthesis